MTSLLTQISSQPTQQGFRFVINGQEKIGKTTLAASCPKPLLLPLEIGATSVVVDKTPKIEQYGVLYQTMQEILQYVQAGQFPYQTLIFDSGSALERMIHEQVMTDDPKRKQETTMETAHGGYGKAYNLATQYFDNFLKFCDYFIQYNINIVITCHCCPVSVIDPQHGEFQQWDMLLHSPKDGKKFGKRELLTQWADLIGFLHEPMFIAKGEGDVTKAMSANQGRSLAVTRDPAYVAGNRYGIENQISIPKENGWNAIAQEIQNSCQLNYFAQ